MYRPRIQFGNNSIFKGGKGADRLDIFVREKVTFDDFNDSGDRIGIPDCNNTRVENRNGAVTVLCPGNAFVNDYIAEIKGERARFEEIREAYEQLKLGQSQQIFVKI